MEKIVNFYDKTKAPAHNYKFKWTVENVSILPDSTQINSNIHFVDNGHTSFFAYFIKYRSYVEIRLNLNRNSGALRIFSKVKVLDCCNKVYDEKTATAYKNESNKESILYFPSIDSTVLNELKLAPNDTWCFIFIIKTYKITSESCYEIGSQQMWEEKTKNSFCANSWKMFKNKIGTDITLKVQDDQIEAHKFVLSAQSPVFAKMFEVPMSESEKNTVVIDDISKAAMTKLIHYMYSKVKIKCSFEIAMELYYAADKYEVLELRELCSKILTGLLVSDNAGLLLEMADKHKDYILKYKVMKFINNNIKSCIKKDWWYELVGKKTELAEELLNFIN